MRNGMYCKYDYRIAFILVALLPWLAPNTTKRYIFCGHPPIKDEGGSTLSRKLEAGENSLTSKEVWYEEHSHEYSNKNEHIAIGIGYEEGTTNRFIAENANKKRKPYSLLELAEQTVYPTSVYEFAIQL